MNTVSKEQLDMNELCQINQFTYEIVVEIVELGIIEQSSLEPNNWRFNSYMVATIHKALRLHHDLDIDWPGVAVALNLLEELDQLRDENKRLQQRLGRFVAES